MKKIYCLIILNCTVFVFANAQLKTKQEKGFFNITNVAEVQYLRSIDSSSVENGMAFVKGGFEAHTITGYFLNPNLSLGLGVGIQHSKTERSYEPNEESAPSVDNGRSMLLLPVFADFRYYPKNSINSPIFILNVGYAPLLKGTNTAEKDLNGGPLVKLGGGYKIYLNNSVSFVPAIYCRAQRFGENTVVGAALSLGLMF